MSDSQALTEVQKILKNERAFLPVAALLAVAMAGLVIWYRLDQGPKAFLAGLLTGSLGAIAVAVYVYVVRLGTALRGEHPSGLLKDACRLASSK
jgi:phosphotransferase system  glucose/maltose/N-acetylglucosamine-specific IIC component